MLGKRIADPLGIEGAPSAVDGLGLLDVSTTLAPAKTLRQVSGTAWNSPFAGYEMHMGETAGPDTARPFARIEGGGAEGATNAAGNVIGTYIHGLLASPDLRSALLERINVTGNGRDHDADVDAALDDIAAELAIHLDIEALLHIAAQPG